MSYFSLTKNLFSFYIYLWYTSAILTVSATKEYRWIVLRVISSPKSRRIRWNSTIFRTLRLTTTSDVTIALHSILRATWQRTLISRRPMSGRSRRKVSRFQLMRRRVAAAAGLNRIDASKDCTSHFIECRLCCTIFGTCVMRPNTSSRAGSLVFPTVWSTR